MLRDLDILLGFSPKFRGVSSTPLSGEECSWGQVARTLF